MYTICDKLVITFSGHIGLTSDWFHTYIRYSCASLRHFHGVDTAKKRSSNCGFPIVTGFATVFVAARCGFRTHGLMVQGDGFAGRQGVVLRVGKCLGDDVKAYSRYSLYNIK